MKDNEKKIMRGEFRGDFTRDTFDPAKAFSRVLMQQGRVQLDADWNEQNSILLHLIRNLATDICGPHWGPVEGAGFEIGNVNNDNDFTIGAGHYYVDGILCEVGINDKEDKEKKRWTYLSQPNHPVTTEINNTGIYLVYLDVWERHISHVEDDAIREKALGGPDTATRSQVVWQVKVVKEESSTSLYFDKYENFIDYLITKNLIFPGAGTMSAQLKDKSIENKEPCLVAPASRYRGAENQLYRVEIHKSSVAESGEAQTATFATFKWSRENASVNFPIMEIKPGDDSNLILELEHLGRDARFSLKPNDWVEIVDDDYTLQNRAEKLLQVESIDHDNRQVTLKYIGGDLDSSMVEINESKSPYLRRWDHSAENGDGVPVEQNTELELEDGMQIKFPANENESLIYQTGDYWLIPARTATGDIEWPKDEKENPKELLPHGVIHHYAPLALIENGKATGQRRILDGLSKLEPSQDVRAASALVKKTTAKRKS